MKETIRRTLEGHRRTAEALLAMDLAPLEAAGALLLRVIQDGGAVVIFGNGGSAADAQHFAAELVGRYRRERPGLRAIALTTDTSILTAVGNDYGFEEVFARQVEALSGPGDLAIAFSTSGNSENVARGLAAARRRGTATIALLGEAGGRTIGHADVSILVPSNETARIQEAHIAIIHAFCELVDERFAGR